MPKRQIQEEEKYQEESTLSPRKVSKTPKTQKP